MLGHATTLAAGRQRAVAGLLVALAVCACGGDKPAPAAEAPAPAAEPSATAAPAPPEPAAAGPRCGDLLSADDLTGIGIDATSLFPDAQAQKGRGVQCTGLPVMATLFVGGDFPTMLAGYKANGASSGLTEVEGPKIGGSSLWTTMSTMSGVMFQSANGRYAANITGSDRALVEKFARVLAANMEKR